ncbi:MAG: DUF3788 domain-containing protein [Candidatus Omnitrophica bacterium]|nr:DUF3788 domain-containing protein [Candidatus Omnitrophota bacterium]
MDEKSLRMVEPVGPPSITKVKTWMGAEAYGFFNHITKTIARRYPGIFIPEWLYGGKKHGWSLRYKKSKSFCTLIPEKGYLRIIIVFGAEERAKVEGIRGELSAPVRRQYDAATTYHDGKWLRLTINSNKVFKDVEALLTIKRKPKG